ncbi:MAG: hypothetical protein ACJA08_003559 [Cyclobacteriaceae bacterium]|jgi:hypothetical protein
MTILSKLSSSQNERSQKPNKALAKSILLGRDLEAVSELQSLLRNPPSEKVLFDVIKVLEMIGESEPEMIKDLFDDLRPILHHKKNMIVWMCMSAISNIAFFHSNKTYDQLASILQIMDEGSIITRDKGFVILVGLYRNLRYRADLSPLIMEQLLKAPDNQFGQYVERWIPVALPSDLVHISRIIEERMEELINPSHRKRAEKNLLKIRKLMK